MKSNACADREIALRKKMNEQPYSVEMNGLVLGVDKGVFPPDFGLTTRYLGEFLKDLKTKRAMDMGCGSGYIALLIKKLNKNSEVWALDIEDLAIECAKKNAKANGLSISISKSNLFSEIPKEVKFDLIAFNHPYYPLKESIFGCGKDGGRETISRFLLETRNHLEDNGVVVMPYSELSGEENNPLDIALGLGYTLQTEIIKTDNAGRHKIYKMKYGTI